MSAPLALTIALALLVINAFFVAAEFAVTSSRMSQIEPLVAAGRRGAGAAKYALEHVSLMLACAQLGITLASTGLGAVAEPAIAHAIEAPLVSAGLPAASAHIVGFTVALLIVVVAHILFGEMIPKNLAVTAPDRLVLILAPILVAIARILRPLVRAMDGIANLILRAFGVSPQSEIGETFTLEEVASIVELSRQEGKLEDDLGLISGTLEFSTETVDAVTVGLGELVCVPVDITPAELDRTVAQTSFSRFPAVDEAGQIIGYIHFKDALHAQSETERSQPLEAWRVRAMPSVAAGAEIEDALALMRANSAHMARVENEHGEAIGVAFLEDIIEELVGEIRDATQRR